ncbi:hypothetical protein LQW54_012976 [Pestalotiopsis sp. IQ-011]
MADDWTMMVYKDPDEAAANTATSTSPSILANRVSWYFDLKGPSIQVNTACSSSMIATDLAVQCLRSGQSSMALVTGSNPLLTPEKSAYLENMSFLSPDSRCYSFDHRANGYARGEGVAVIVLKRLSDAVRNGDMIRAVIRASGSNQDGHTPGITQPSLASQEELIRKVYKSCALDFKLTRYVEAHGTGTQLGDSTETKALGRVFRTSRSPKEPLYIGSVKANIGHTEGVSGLAGILKSILILEKGLIPPNALFEKWNPKINAKFNNLKVPTSCLPWPTSGLRRISINSFGFGGSNGHVILDDAFHTMEALAIQALTITPTCLLRSTETSRPIANGHTNGHTNGLLSNGRKPKEETLLVDDQSRQAQPHDGELNFEVKPVTFDSHDDQQVKQDMVNGTVEPQEFRLLVWSAKDEAALERMLQDYSGYFERNGPSSHGLLESLAYTLSARRSLMAWRSFSVVNSTVSPSKGPQLLPSKCTRTSRECGLAFVFTGQGAQYVKMGLDLLVYPVFSATLSRASDLFRQLGADWFLLDELRSSDRIHAPQISQPLCTALQIALTELLWHFGINPDAVVGHSSGEIAAAYAVGALSIESACRIAFHRGRLAQRLVMSSTDAGGMMSVNISEANVDEYLEKAGLGAEVTVACINSPQNITLSGDDTALDKLQKCLDEDEIFSRRLQTGVAYHSPAMKQISDEYRCSLATLEGRATGSSILMASSVTGQKISAAALSQSQYWVDNLVSPVRFADALQYLALAAPKADGLKTISDYIEIGPHAALKRPVLDTLGNVTRAKEFRYLSVLSKFESSIKSTLSAVGQLFVHGYPVSVGAVNQQDQDAQGSLFLVDTPQYPFNHSQSHWHETRISRNWRFREAVPRSILGVRVTDWNPLQPRWRKMLRVSEIPWLEDHVIGGNILFPATGSLTMALEAVRQMAQPHQIITGYQVKEATFLKPIVIRPERETEVITHLRPLQQSYEKGALRFEVQLFTVVDEYWSECFKSTIHIQYDELKNEVDMQQESDVTAQMATSEFSDARAKAIFPIDETEFYAHHRRQGLSYGDVFSIARDISWDGKGLAVAQWRIFREVAQNQVPLARGDTDVTDLFSATGLLNRFYEGLFKRFHDSRLRSFLQLAVHQNSALRILEIGGGSGYMADLILSIIGEIEEETQGVAFREYVFTDTSDLNFENVRKRLSHSGKRITFKTLDFDHDIVSQGFQSGGFDMVIAGDVLHVTKDVSAVLQSLRSILKPSGNLLLCEHTVRDSIDINFGFGILPSWWRSEDKARASTPLMTEPEWDAALRKNGFSGSQLIIRDYESHGAHRASLIATTATQPSQLPSEDRRSLLVISGENEFEKEVAALLKESLSLGHLHHSSIISIGELADTAPTISDWVIFLADLGNPLLAEISESIFKSVKGLIQRTENLFWVTSASAGTSQQWNHFAGIKDGFLRTLRSEFNDKRIVSLSLEDMFQSSSDCASQISLIFTASSGDTSRELEYVVRGDQILTGRLVEDTRLNHELSASIRPETHKSPWLPGPPLKLDVGSRGQLETLHFKEDIDYYQELGPVDVEIDAKAWAVNFRDVFSALGRLDEPELGSDCAGVVTRVGSQCTSVQPGDRVAMCLIDCMRMYPRADEQAVVKIPPSVSFEEACAVINPGMTAWHCLVDLAQLQKGEKVLIHGASGATGQLSIQIAQHIGAEVFVTVGYSNKKELLMDLYGVPADHIFYSRSNNASFAKSIKRMTNGYGVDVVINSLVGEGLRASWECIAPYGRFIEIGKTDINTNSSLPMLPFAKNAMFASVDIRHLLLNRKQVALELLHKTMTMMDEGTIHYPKPLNIYDVGSVEDAFRYIQSGRNSGRVVIHIDPAIEVQKCLITRRDWKFASDASYLVVGCFGGVGRSILRWMVSKGATSLIIPTRSAVLSAAAVDIMEEFRGQGITITTVGCDVASRDMLARALEDWRQTLPPIRGCINAAMVLNDAVYENILVSDLDWMVLLSSVSGIVGNPGQANYAAGCTFQDSLARYRTEHGQKTISIDLGVMRSVGVVAESEILQNHFGEGSRGLGQIEEQELLALLDIICDPATDKTLAPAGQIIMGLGTPVDFLTQSLEVPEIMERPLFAHFSQTTSSEQPDSDNTAGDNLTRMYRQAATAEERAKIAAQSLAGKLARALAIEAQDVDVGKPLHAFGVDSLVAIELRNWIAKEFSADVPVFEIMGGRTVEGIGELIEKSSQFGRGT